MQLDPSIILQAGRGVTPLENPYEVQSKLLGLEQAKLQLAGMRQQQEEAAGMRRDIAEAGGDPAALKTALLKRGKVKEVHEMTIAEKQAQEAEARRAKAHLDSVNGLNQQQLQVYQSALDALDKDPTQAQAIHSFVLGKTLENAKTLFPQMDTSKTDDPPGFQDVTQQRAWLQNKISGAMTFDQRLKMADQAIQEKVAAGFGGFHPAVGPDGKPGIFQTNKAGEVRQVPGLRPVPSAAGAGHGMGAPPANPKAEAGTAQERLEGVPADLRALVKQIGTYQMMSSQLSPRQKNQVMGYVAQVFPNYSVGDAEANIKFMRSLAASDPASAGGTIAASERLLGHVGELADLTDKLGNSAIGKVGNIVFGAVDRATGTGKAGDIKSFELVKGKVIAELNKLANGGVPHAEEMKEDIKQLTFSDPPDVKYKVLQAAAALGLEQTHAKEAQRDNLLGDFSPKTSFLSPRAQGVVKRIWKNAGAGDPGLATPTTGTGYTTTAQVKEPYAKPAVPAPATKLRVSPEEAAKLPKGTKFLTLDGREMVKN